MKKGLVLALSLFVLLGTGVSCKQKCNIPEEDTVSGVIVPDVVIYPQSGGMIIPSGLHIHSGTSQSTKDKFEISMDGGISRQSVDYSQYNILGYPLTVSCDAAIQREVIIDDINQFVYFNVKVDECKDGCDELRNIENYVLVPAFNPSYTIVYTVDQ